MSIATELTRLAANRDAIKAAIEAKGVSDAGDTLSGFPAAIASIPSGEPEYSWEKPAAWPDIKSILAEDTHAYSYKRIELLNTKMLATYLTGGVAYYTSEGNLYTTSVTITWDPTKDIVASDGSRYRWVITFSSNGTFNNLCGVASNLLWYVLGTGATASHTFNGRYMCQKVEGQIVFGNSQNFSGCASLCEIEGAVTSSVTNGASLFTDCARLVKLAAGTTFPNVTSCNSMFSGCMALASLPDGFKVTSSTSANAMFVNCYSLKHLPSGFSCPSVTTATYLFQNCYSLAELPDGFETASGANHYGMFYGCHSLVTIPSSLASCLENSVNLGSVFQYCWKLRYIPPIVSSGSCSSIGGMLREVINIECEIPKIDLGNSTCASGYGDFTHGSWVFPDVFIATNLTGSAAFPAGYLNINKIPSKIVVNVPVNLPCGKVGSGERDRIATFDANGNVNGGVIYYVYDLTSASGYESGTYKEWKFYQLSNDVKNAFTTAQKDAIGAYLNARGWTLSW